MTTEEKIHAVKELLGPFAANFVEATVDAVKRSDDQSVPESYVFGHGCDLGEWLSKAPNSIFPPGAHVGLRMLSKDGIGEIFTDLVSVMLGLQGCELKRGSVPWAQKDVPQDKIIPLYLETVDLSKLLSENPDKKSPYGVLTDY